MSHYHCPSCGRQYAEAVAQCTQCGTLMVGLSATKDAVGIKRKFVIFFVILVVICAVAIVLLPR